MYKFSRNIQEMFNDIHMQGRLVLYLKEWNEVTNVSKVYNKYEISIIILHTKYCMLD